jgi:hypothetical protein
VSFVVVLLVAFVRRGALANITIGSARKARREATSWFLTGKVFSRRVLRSNSVPHVRIRTPGLLVETHSANSKICLAEFLKAVNHGKTCKTTQSQFLAAGFPSVAGTVFAVGAIEAECSGITDSPTRCHE